MTALPRTCAVCGKPLTGRNSRRTCSTNCRKRLSRRRETIQDTEQQIIRALRSLIRLAEQYDDIHTEIASALIAITGECYRIETRYLSLNNQPPVTRYLRPQDRNTEE